MKETVLLNGIERPIMSAEEASRAGYRAFTYGYNPEVELWMMHNVAKDLDKQGDGLCCVEVIDRRSPNFLWLEIWRRTYQKRIKSDV